MSSRQLFKVIEGQKDKRKIACTWCGEMFFDRMGLENHWLKAPYCKRNRNVNNPTQEKSMTFTREEVTGEQPSEE
jgi:hypothetical protein